MKHTLSDSLKAGVKRVFYSLGLALNQFFLPNKEYRQALWLKAGVSESFNLALIAGVKQGFSSVGFSLEPISAIYP